MSVPYLVVVSGTADYPSVMPYSNFSDRIISSSLVFSAQVRLEVGARFLRVLFFFLLFIVSGAVAGQSAAKQSEVERAARQQMKQYTERFASGDSTARTDIQALLESHAQPRVLRDSLYDIVVRFSNSLSNQGRYAESISLLRLLAKQAEKVNDKTTVLLCLLDVAFDYQQLQQPDSARLFLSRVEKIGIQGQPIVVPVSYYNTKAIVAKQNGKYLEAIDYSLRALEIPDAQARNIGEVKENIGVLYQSLGNYQRSVAYLNEARLIQEAGAEKEILLRLYTGLGISYMRMDSLSQAEKFHQKAIALCDTNSFELARSLANFGNVLRRQGALTRSLACIDSSIRICERLQIPFGVALNQVNRANVLVDMKKPVEALQALSAVSKSPFGSIPDFLPEICEISHKAHQMLGNTALAYSFLNRFTMLRDSIDKEGARLLVFEWEERILREKKDKELAALNTELRAANQRQRILFLFSAMALLLLFAAGRIFFLRAQKQRLRARLAEEEKENLRLTLEMKERELTSQSMHLQSIGGFAENVLGKLSSLKTNMEGEKAEELARIIRDFETGIPEELWDDFRVRFEKINEDFYQKLLQICPDLSPVEIKIASFLRLNLSSKEISRLTNRSAGTISNTRSALRKKLNLDDEDNLVAFLMSL